MRSGVTSGECVASQVHATPYARAISSDRARQAKSPGKHAVDAHNPRALRSVGCAASAKSQSVSGLKRASQVKVFPDKTF